MTNGSIAGSTPRSPALGANTTSGSLSILLLRQDTTVAELVAPDSTVFSEWLDGLNLLVPDGYISTKETADYVQILTDIGVKIKLLDLSGERLEIPSTLPLPIVPPASVPFHYAE
jgi:engulfment/cell motility protein 1